MPEPRLRDSSRLRTHELYPLSQIPNDIIQRISAYIVYLVASGRRDMSGNEWGDCFAYAIGGTHLSSPLGIADVIYNTQAWSCKTVKQRDPSTISKVRLISGRNSPDFSYNIHDPHKDVQKTGTAVLNIWNTRVQIARQDFNPVRTIVLVRNYDLTSFCIYEEDNYMYSTDQFTWEENDNNNLIGNKGEDTYFTWQPHGSQFTIHSNVPANAIKFTVRRPIVFTKEVIWDTVGFDESWVQISR